MKQNGAIHSLLKLYGNCLIKQEIPLYKILRHIPDIDSFYFRLVGSVSLIAKNTKNTKNEYIIFGDYIDNETNEIFETFSLMGNILSNSGMFACYETMKTKQYFEDGRFNKNNVFYKDYMNIPEKYEEGLKDINISFYCYLMNNITEKLRTMRIQYGEDVMLPWKEKVR